MASLAPVFAACTHDDCAHCPALIIVNASGWTITHFCQCPCHDPAPEPEPEPGCICPCHAPCQVCDTEHEPLLGEFHD